MRRGRNGLTKEEFLQLERDAEWAKRVDEALANAAKKRVKAEAEKCYPVPSGNVSTCPKNVAGRCSSFDKKCNNVSRDKIIEVQND